ncbi:Ribosomal RNA small subunit methyltransferase A [bioreactor metagenome]|jgi:16S rRNA (adenine1518-N6/adenine1519-N6)-dimethyltransferase|uniref:Ribosomal RNA small subunit methyltransferase A n=1 Tax=bioreactor metagenome TaxID=1076179 RepID=A0A644V7D1_9ZZZZ|nr:16S rRNA (adenine(1518)-N(6)/adenine(1519)-N(6))-dimethyltransferase RsmA [Lentimicrobium sp.]MEA5110844.1 16S rRNA (adenine(1518)-N(6)/adenine(1519)-N(6))-dimethyltransferase RsmA [Lentimicrobium sp.]
MEPVRAKKHLGQHFLKDENIARKITDSLNLPCEALLEIGPGTGVLTKYLLELPVNKFLAIDVDREAVPYLKKTFPEAADNFIEGDFLRIPVDQLFDGPFSVIGNFPYNISSQILFRVLDHRNQIPEVVGMFQKEVAERIAAPPGSKTYGIMSVLLQAWYDIEYLFTVGAEVFVPPPKVESAVIRLKRNQVQSLGCDEKLFVNIVKTAFNQRRKTLRNALKSFRFSPDDALEELLTKRAERLGVEEFVFITNQVMEAT